MSFLKFIFLILVVALILLFFLLKGKHHVNVHNRIVLSLTTTPDRLPFIQPTLKCLVNQTRAADAIYLNLPYYLKRTGEPYLLPKWLSEYPEVTVNRCDDVGPATKLIPTLEREKDPETLIIVVDDDIWYPPYLVLKYLKYSSKFPEEVLTLGGVVLGTKKNKFRLSLLDNVRNVLLPHVFIVCGHASYVVRRKFFADDFSSFLEASFYEKSCFVSDDLTISYYLETQGVKKRCLKYPDFSWFHFKVLDLGLKKDALHNLNDNPVKYNSCYQHLETL